MPFAPAETFVTATALTAADVIANNDALREYLEKIADDAWNTGQFVGTQHIMRGQFNPTINQAHMVSGIYEGHVYTLNATQYTYGTGWNTMKLGTAVDQYVPLTAFTVTTRHPSSLLYNWWAHPAGRNTSAGSPAAAAANIYPYLSNRSNQQTDHGTQVVQESSAPEEAARERRFQSSGFLAVTLANQVNEYSVGLLIKADKNFQKIQFLAWGCTLEVFYI